MAGVRRKAVTFPLIAKVLQPTHNIHGHNYHVPTRGWRSDKADAKKIKGMRQSATAGKNLLMALDHIKQERKKVSK